MDSKLIRRNASKQQAQLFSSITSVTCYCQENKYVGQPVEDLSCIEKYYNKYDSSKLYQISEHEFELRMHSAEWYMISTKPVESTITQVTSEPVEVEPAAEPNTAQKTLRGSDIKLMDAKVRQGETEFKNHLHHAKIVNKFMYGGSLDKTGNALGGIGMFIQDSTDKIESSPQEHEERVDTDSTMPKQEPFNVESLLDKTDRQRINFLRKEVDRKYKEIQAALDEINELKAKLANN